MSDDQEARPESATVRPIDGSHSTTPAAAPWTIVKSDDKKRARLNCMQDFF